MLSQMFMMVKQPPFTGQSNQAETLAKMTADLELLKGQAGEQDPASFIKGYEQALVRRPHDLMLRFGFAKLLEELGRPDLAKRESDYIEHRMPVTVFGATP